MAVLSSVFAAASALVGGVAESINVPGGLWEWLILKVFSFISSYGWRIVVFIILLKLLLLPLDLFQRIKMRKNAKITEELKPQIEKLQKQYGNDKTTLSQKQMELNKKAGFSYFSSCLPMIVTLVVFFTLFSGLNKISQYMMFRQYANWYDVYTAAYTQYLDENPQLSAEITDLETQIADKEEELKHALEATDPPIESSVIAELERQLRELKGRLDSVNKPIKEAGQDKVVEYNQEHADSFLWIKSVWQPDVMWRTPIYANKDEFIKNTRDYSNKNKGKLDKDTLNIMLAAYDDVTDKLVKSADNKQNGLLILVILAVVLSVFSQFINQRLQKKSGQLQANGATPGMGGMMKAMMFIMPVMIGIFALQYTAAFAIYMVTNSAITILVNLITTLTMNLIDRRSRMLAEDAVVHYGRPDPQAQQTKKEKGRKNEIVHKQGRPDPEDRSDGKQ